MVESSRRIALRGYVSGVASLLDKATGARDLGFGLDIVDFLLEPAPDPEQHPRGTVSRSGRTTPFHGNIPKRYVEGPQICTQAKSLPVQVINGEGFTAVRQHYRWNKAYPLTTRPARSGSKH